MTKQQLIKALEPYPDNMDIFLDERLSEFTYGLLNGVRKQEIVFMEDPNGEVLSTNEVIILSEQ